jgi:predicted MFS family arabinose efflux permease
MAAGFAAAAAAAATLPLAGNPVPLFIIIALAAGLPAGLIMTLPVQVLRPTNRAAGMGVYFTCYYAGMAVLPAIAGSLRDRFGIATAPVLFAAAMMVLALVLLGVFRALQQEHALPAEQRS